MIDIGQNTFNLIAVKMLEKNLSIRELFENMIHTETIGKENLEVITFDNFVKGIQSLEAPDIKEIQYSCLLKILAVNDDQNLIRLSDLIQILADFSIPEAKQKQKHHAPTQNFESMDPISMILMLALTEYMIKNNIPLYDLFGDSIQQKAIKIKGKEKSVEVILSSDFFAILDKIGIKIEDNEHEDLKKFLCLDKKCTNQIYIKRLKLAINEFATNEELREIARGHYDKLIEGQDAYK